MLPCFSSPLTSIPSLLGCLLPLLFIHTGVDTRALEAVRDSLNFEKVLNMPELARFIDQDSYISDVMRGKKQVVGGR